MTGTSLLAHFLPSTSRRSSTPDESRNENFELRHLGSSVPAKQALRPSRVSNAPAAIAVLSARKCAAQPANPVATICNEISNWFGGFGRKPEQLPAPAMHRAVSMEKLRAILSQAAIKLNAALEPVKARFAHAKNLFSGKACPPRAQAATVRPHHDSQSSGHRFATLKEVLRTDWKKSPSAGSFIKQVNRLYYRSKLASQINELNLAELEFLWSQLSRGSRHTLASGARTMLCARGNKLLCIGFQADGIARQDQVARGKPQLPAWAAMAPAEWNPKAALRKAYGMQSGQRGVRSSAARPSAAASLQNHPQRAAPAAPRDKAASAPASGSRPSR